jgi:hypothetical protein
MIKEAGLPGASSVGASVARDVELHAAKIAVREISRPPQNIRFLIVIDNSFG